MLNLDDIFGDVVFTPDGDTFFLLELGDNGQVNCGEGNNVATMANRPTGTTQLKEDGMPALAMGDFVQETKAVPYRKKPQADHRLQYAAPGKMRRAGLDVHSMKMRWRIYS
jgi:endonuclease/exonuclease/phosphatase family metal-dependent hydrolase